MKNGRKIHTLKSLQSVLTICIALLLTSTVFSSSLALSNKIFDNQNTESKIEKILEVKERIESYATIKSFLEGIKNLHYLKSANYGLSFTTNYDGIETTTRLTLYRTKLIDINDDSKYDISVKYLIYPSITAPFALTINFKLKINRMTNFPDEDVFFEGYTELKFPGMLNKNITGDSIRFGYESPSGEEVPDSCVVTYKFTPHLLNIRKKVEHIVDIDPGSTSDKDDIVLLFGYVDREDDETVSEDSFRTIFTPAVKGSVSFSGYRKLGKTTWSLETTKKDDSKVNIYLAHKENNNITYLYAKKIPSEITISLKLDRNGLLEIDSNGEPIDEAGICDDFYNPVNRLFVKEIPKKVSLEWKIDLLIHGKASAKIYCEGTGVSLNGHLEGANYTADFRVKSQNTIDCSLEIDVRERYLLIDRTKSNLLVSLVVLENASKIVEGSFKLKTGFEKPLKIYFNKINNDYSEVEISLAGQKLEILDLNIKISTELIGGELTIKMARLYKENDGSITIIFSRHMSLENISGEVTLDIKNGVSITDLTLSFNDFVFHRGDVNIAGNSVRHYSFSIDIDIEWHVYEDYGYIIIRADSNVFFSFDSTYKDESEELIGIVRGTIKLKSTSDVFNISWRKIDENYTFAIDGSAAVELADFYLWLKDIAEISIPRISVAFTITTSYESGKLLLNLDDTIIDFEVDIEKITITNLLNLTIKGNFYINIYGSASGTIDITWNETGLTSLNANVGANVQGEIDITNFIFKIKEKMLNVSINRLYISGDLGFSLSIIDVTNITLSASGEFTDVKLSGFRISGGIVIDGDTIFNQYGLSADIDVSFSGRAIFTLKYIDETFLLDATLYGDSNIEINSLWIFIGPIFMEINIEYLYIGGSTTIIFKVDSSDKIPLNVILYTDENITAEYMFVGSGDAFQIYIRDMTVDICDGWISLGVNSETFLPVIELSESKFSLGYFALSLSGSFIGPIENILFEGSMTIEGFVDIFSFEYVYLKGRVNKNSEILLENSGLLIALEPGILDIIMNLPVAAPSYPNQPIHVAIYGYSSGWISLYGPKNNFIKVMGAIDVLVALHVSDDGTISAIIDAKEVSGVVNVCDILRFAGELDVFVDLSVKIEQTEDSILISDLHLDITGDISGIIQIKGNETEWIPIYPFTSSGNVLLFKKGGLLGGSPQLANAFIKTPYDNASIGFEAWYSPPISLNGGEIGPYTYKISFDDGTYYEITSTETEVFIPDHNYGIGKYNPSVVVTTSDPSVSPVSDSLSVEIVNGNYISILEYLPPYGLEFTYDDVAEDGKIHIPLHIINNADKDYILNWESYVVDPYDGDESKWFIEPSSGILDPQETTNVNVSFYPPSIPSGFDPESRLVGSIILNNSNYAGYDKYGEDSTGFTIYIVKDLLASQDIFPFGPLYLPDLDPGDSITGSFWIWNNPDIKKSFNWRIVDYPDNGTWSFSSTSGTIPIGGSEVVYFTVTAPYEYGIDLGGKIKFINTDNPLDYAERSIFLQTKGNNSGSNNSVVVSEDENGNISIRIGGYNQVNIDNFEFTVNGLSGYINGNFIFDTSTSYVFINWTKGDLSTLSLDGTAEFTIENFAFGLGNNISISISKVITGGIHWRDGKSGNFSMAVNNTFVDVDIDLSFDYQYANFSFSGNIDVDIDSVSDGTLFIDWDLNNENKEISIYSDLFHESNIEVYITDLMIHLNNFTFSAEYFHFSRILNLSWTSSGISIESGSSIEAGDVFFSLGEETEIFTANANIEIDGILQFNINPVGSGYEFCIYTDGFDLNGEIYVEYGEYHYHLETSLKMTGTFCFGMEVG